MIRDGDCSCSVPDWALGMGHGEIGRWGDREMGRWGGRGGRGGRGRNN